jgi:hypothetical protein
MLHRESIVLAVLPPDSPPLLLVIVDTEEDFDWASPLSREATAVRSIPDQRRAQEIFDERGVVPTYVIDYPVATSGAAVEVLGPLLADGRCEIGAHLHPWVNPPHEESVSSYNSFPGNLPKALERAKLARLTDAITDAFGKRPTIYKAGRYGVGPATSAILEELGYDVDISVVPFTSFTADVGPDFSDFGARPYWFGDRRKLLEIPLSVGFCGVLAKLGRGLYPILASRPGMMMRAPGLCARLGVLERIRLTPEGADYAALRRLTESMLAQGHRIFSLTYHSPSLAPGNTPYVADRADLETFLRTIAQYLEYFINDVGGRPTTLTALYRLLR